MAPFSSAFGGSWCLSASDLHHPLGLRRCSLSRAHISWCICFSAHIHFIAVSFDHSCVCVCVCAAINLPNDKNGMRPCGGKGKPGATVRARQRPNKKQRYINFKMHSSSISICFVPVCIMPKRPQNTRHSWHCAVCPTLLLCVRLWMVYLFCIVGGHVVALLIGYLFLPQANAHNEMRPKCYMNQTTQAFGPNESKRQLHRTSPKDVPTSRIVAPRARAHRNGICRHRRQQQQHNYMPMAYA